MVQLNELENINSKWGKFINDYTPDFIEKEMTLEQYAVGLGGSNKSFCYRIEYELQPLGELRGRDASKYEIYFNIKSQSYKFNENFGNNLDDAFTCLKIELAKLIRETQNLSTFKDVESKIPQGVFKYKVMYIYKPDIMIPINSTQHCKKFCEILGLGNYTNYEDCQHALMTYKNSNFPDWTTRRFMLHLYEKYPEVKNKKSSKKTETSKLIEQSKNSNKTNEINHIDAETPTQDDEKNVESLIESINAKNISAEFNAKKLKQILPHNNKPIEHIYGEKKTSGTLETAVRKINNGRKAEKYFISYLTYLNFVQDKDFTYVANSKRYPYDIQFKSIGLEIKNIKSGSFYLTDTEIALLLKNKTRLVFVDVNNGIWLLKKNSTWLKKVIERIVDIREYCNTIYSNIDLTDIRILITDDIDKDVIDISQCNKAELSELL